MKYFNYFYHRTDYTVHFDYMVPVNTELPLYILLGILKLKKRLNIFNLKFLYLFLRNFMWAFKCIFC